MESPIYDSKASVQQLLHRGFEMPIHFAAVGANGSVVAGTFTMLPGGQGMDCQITVPTSKAEGLTAPVNIMYVDSKGDSALVVVRQSKGQPEIH
jgi:hypothetical protein